MPYEYRRRHNRKTDLSQQTGNPTRAIQDNYERLMSIEDPDELVQAANDLVRPMVGTGISNTNYKKFINNLRSSTERGIDGIKYFLTNYMLRGSGLGVESKIGAIASILTEDANVFIELTPHQQRLKQLVESYGYDVAVLERR